jgi:UPF0755 protein
MRSRLAVYIASAIIILCATVVLALLGLQTYLNTPVVAQHQVIEIRRGSGMQQIANQLSREINLSYPRLFSLWGRYHRYDRVLRSGEFRLTAGMSPKQVAEHLVSGSVVQYPAAIIEGTHYRQALESLWTSPKLKSSLKDKSEREIIAAVGAPYESLEGLFFPDTYFYSAGDTDLSILMRAYQRLEQVLAEQWETRAVGLPYETPYEALIMASIVEKETGVDSEREDIAGVFVRRLNRRMRLQSDPTVIYGMGDNYQGDIRRTDLAQRTAYNTYRIDGLPPTPIALASTRAIHASLHPKDGDTLYFVATGDGGHEFSRTLDEHNAAVRRYLQNSRQQQN